MVKKKIILRLKKNGEEKMNIKTKMNIKAKKEW